MKYVIWCDLIYAWVGDLDEESGKYKVSTVVDKAKVFGTVSQALEAMKVLPKHWASHMEIQEYTKSTQRDVQKAYAELVQPKKEPTS